MARVVAFAFLLAAVSYRASYGLGVEPPEPRTDPWYVPLLTQIADPLSGALAQRIAYGRTEPTTGFYPAAPAPAQTSALGGISSTTLLLGAAALFAVMMLRK